LRNADHSERFRLRDRDELEDLLGLRDRRRRGGLVECEHFSLGGRGTAGVCRLALASSWATDLLAHGAQVPEADLGEHLQRLTLHAPQVEEEHLS
jgi:hypothetical protein